MNLRQHRELRVVIGSKYQGPPLDRPALRTMPAGWKLETDEVKGDTAVKWICWLAFAFALVEAVVAWVKL